MNSIRKRVLVSFLSILALGTIAVCISTYLGIRSEMDEVYDANMRQLALMASSLPLADIKAHSTIASSKEWPHGEEVFLIQIWENEKLEYSSHPLADFPLQENKGHGRVFFHGKKWGYYQENVQGHVVQVSQELHFRRDVIREVYNAVIIPVLIQFPLLSILVWFFVGYGFRPLEKISALIQSRTAHFMEPISPENAPKEIQALVIALNDLLYRLKVSLETQRQFTADAAHELRTPLTAVRLQLDLLKRADRPEDRIEAVETLERGVDRSIRLVQQLLELARQEPDNQIRSFANVDLDLIVKNAVLESKVMADKKTIAVDPVFGNVLVMGDGTSLAVLIGNILTNAIAYTQAGGQVAVKTYYGAGTPILEIADNGIGIAPENHARVFDRFYRVMGTGTTGSGLGLSIVKNIAERHGATIQLSTGIGRKGTSFRFIFPKA